MKNDGMSFVIPQEQHAIKQASTMMSVLRYRYVTSSLLLCLLCFLVDIPSGTSLSPGDITKLSRREALKRFPVVASISVGSLLSVSVLPSQAHAAAFQEDLRSSLKPASDDQPQIPLPTSQDAQSETTVVEGKFACSCYLDLYKLRLRTHSNCCDDTVLKLSLTQNNQNIQAY
jgi:hypothetical protein